MESILMNPHCHQCLNSQHRVCLDNVGFSWKPHGEKEGYVDFKQEKSSVLQWGQLKLLMMELLFLKPYMETENVCVVYAGASPGHHLKVLVELMPCTWKWHLYDKSQNEVFCKEGEEYYEKVSKVCRGGVYHEMVKQRHEELEQQTNELITVIQDLEKRKAPIAFINRRLIKLKELQHTLPIWREHNPNVIVHDQYLDLEEASNLRKQYMRRPCSDQDPQLLFISDIRTVSHEQGVESDMKLQMELTCMLQPYQASLKFKLPYSDSYPQSIQYLDGTLMLQPFTRPWSHETRLFTLKGAELLKTTQYSRIKYNSQLFTHQSTTRSSIHRDTQPATESHTELIREGVAIDKCFDCSAAVIIIKELGITMDDFNTIIGKLRHACI